MISDTPTTSDFRPEVISRCASALHVSPRPAKQRKDEWVGDELELQCKDTLTSCRPAGAAGRAASKYSGNAQDALPPGTVTISAQLASGNRMPAQAHRRHKCEH